MKLWHLGLIYAATFIVSIGAMAICVWLGALIVKAVFI